MLTNIYSTQTVSVSDLKKNLSAVLHAIGEEPVAVLNYNKPAAYLLSAHHYEKILDILEDREDVELAKQRADAPRIKVSRERLLGS